MFDSEYQIERSRAIEPLFFRAPAPNGPKSTPREFQHAGVEYALGRNHCLIGDEPGVGKTAQGILISNAIKAKRTLVVCPASLRLNWEREIWQWSTKENVQVYVIQSARDGVSEEADFVVVSYDLLRNPAILEGIMACHWDHAILDEAHAIKDPKGNKRTRAICAPDLLPSVTGRFTLLSGTILPNQPIECLGADTLVLTNRGWVAITDVTTDDLLWDGVEWVKHAGLVYQGEKPTLEIAGLTVTGNHEIALGDDWVKADFLTGNTLHQALATGSASLPSRALPEASREASWASLFSALAALRRSLQPQPTYQLAEQPGVGRAARKWAHSLPTQNTMRSSRPAHLGQTCLVAFRTLWPAATTQRTLNTTATEGGAYGFGPDGAAAERRGSRSSPILCRFRDTTVQTLSLTGGTQIADTSLATSGSSPVKSTAETSGRCATSSSEFTSLKPVYDLTNAGPRRRFTVLTERGPLLVHNCYNAVRLLDWEAIDCMSDEDFRDHYYAMGGGYVRKMVWDEEIGAKVSKNVWSDKVRNVPIRLDELQRRLRSRIMIRRLKEQVHTQLPAKQHKLVPLALTPEMKAAMKHPGWAEVSKLYDLDPENFQADMPVDGAVSSARRLLGEAKIGPVCDYIEELLQEGVNKIVVSAWHTTVLAEARLRLTKLGLEQKDGHKFKVAYMDGGTSSLKRQAAVDEFQNDPSTRIILGQTQVMGEGHTLTAAQDVVLAEPDWVPGRITQMVDRIHRLGQTGSHVIAHLPVAAGTLDERVIATAIQKDRVIFAALDAVS